MIHSILLIGQSNMSGRGYLDEAPELDNRSLKVNRNGRWWPLYRPVNPDRVTAGYNLAESFALRYRDGHPGVDVGIIPCADGGTSVTQWQPGSILYDHAVLMGRLAQRTSHIVAVLWHQGESDARTADRALPYSERFLRMARSLRRDLQLEDVPFIVGGLGDFMPRFINRNGEPYPYWEEINRQLRELAQREPLTGFASAEGLKDRGDSLHFGTPALVEFGERYYEAFLPLEDRNRVFGEKPEMDAAVRSAMEFL